MSYVQKEDVAFGEGKFEIISDGVYTIVKIINSDGGFVGQGVAKRKKGDRRNSQLGVDLAAMRAFEDAAKFMREEVLKKYGPIATPSVKPKPFTDDCPLCKGRCRLI